MLIDFYIRYRNYFHYAFLRRKGKETPLPLSFWEEEKKRLNRYSSKTDILLPAQRLVKSKGSRVSIGAISGMIGQDTIGVWTLDRLTIVTIWMQLLHFRPKVIAECGCGISSLVIAKYLSLGLSDGICISFEQSEPEKRRVEDRLTREGINDRVHIIHTPVNDKGEYIFNEEQILAALGGKQLECIIIDGPGGPDKCRENTLPSLMKFAAPDCRWWIDDALRDGEMEFLRTWEQLPGIKVAGIIPVGKGLGAGTVCFSPGQKKGD